MKDFIQWTKDTGRYEEMAGATGAVFDSKAKLKDANWEGAPGKPAKIIAGEPIKAKKRSG